MITVRRVSTLPGVLYERDVTVVQRRVVRTNLGDVIHNRRAEYDRACQRENQHFIAIDGQFDHGKEHHHRTNTEKDRPEDVS